MKRQIRKMETPDKVRQLVERFDLHRDQSKSPEYKEAEVRQAFDPLVYELYDLTDEEISIVEGKEYGW